MQLTSRALGLLLFTVPLLAGAVYASGLVWLALLWLVFVVALLLSDRRLTPQANAWTVVRSHDQRLSLAIQNRITVQVRLRPGGRALQVWLRDEPPPSFGLSAADRVLTALVTPGTVQTLVYAVRPPRRGDYHFGDLHLRWNSTLGLLRCQATFPAAGAVKVYPNLVDVKKYDLLLRKNRLWTLGLRNTRLLGSGAEFERLRDYLPDDEYRHINWKATARRSKPITVAYETERSQTIIALLDVGRMMRSPVGDVAKLDYAINAVLLLAFVAAQKGDKVGLLAFADTVQTWVAPRSGKGQFQRMLEQLYAVEGQAVEPDYAAAFGYLAVKQSKRSLVLLFTDLTGSISTEALLAQISRLRKRHLPLLVTVRDPTVQRLAQQPVIDSTSLYQRTVAEAMLDERRLTLERLQQQGVLTLDVAADELSIAVINRYLALKARTVL
ncbi:MAG: DUF58 domain-containing protein [Chloroflexota bacterium]|nr:DUF58 domain-containing protein [Chloroflexota bacterium]